MVKVAVLGAGPNGMATAFRIKENFKDFDVVVMAKDFTPTTTGDGSGGLWYPYLCSNTPMFRLRKWSIETYKHLHKQWLHGGLNICMIPVNVLNSKEIEYDIPEWSQDVFGFTEFSNKELSYLSKLHSNKYVSGHKFTTFVVHPPTIISHFTNLFYKAGGRILQREITSLKDPILKDYDVVINCTGLGARDIVPDPKVYPIRGQISKVLAPWLNDVIFNTVSENYIIPNYSMCVLGGTHQENDFNTNCYKDDTELIFNGCKNIEPSLKHAEIVEHWVGLRPARDELRLEAEILDGKLFIHNYGHGGSGLTLFWGCSSEVLKLVEDKLVKTSKVFNSKL